MTLDAKDLEDARGTVVQLIPDLQIQSLAGSFMTVVEAFPDYSVQGYVLVPSMRKHDGPTMIWYRAKRGEFEFIGHAVTLFQPDVGPEEIASMVASTVPCSKHGPQCRGDHQ